MGCACSENRTNRNKVRIKNVTTNDENEVEQMSKILNPLNKEKIAKKRYNANMQLIEKWSMPTKYREKRNYVGTYCRDLIRSKSKDVLLIKKKVVKKKYDIDNDLDELLHYDQ